MNNFYPKFFRIVFCYVLERFRILYASKKVRKYNNNSSKSFLKNFGKKVVSPSNSKQLISEILSLQMTALKTFSRIKGNQRTLNRVMGIYCIDDLSHGNLLSVVFLCSTENLILCVYVCEVKRLCWQFTCPTRGR